MSEDAGAVRAAQPDLLFGRFNSPSDRTLEVLAAVLLSLTTIAATWCAYQATRWSGVQASSFAEASSVRLESTRRFDHGLQLESLDVSVFADYAVALAHGDEELTGFYEARVFRQGFLPVLADWRASDPLTNPDAPRNPFEDEAYLESLFGESALLEQEAERLFQKASDANQVGDDYILSTVFLASVLFFAGVATKFPSKEVQVGLFAFGLVVFVVVTVQMIGMPIQ